MSSKIPGTSSNTSLKKQKGVDADIKTLKKFHAPVLNEPNRRQGPTSLVSLKNVLITLFIANESTSTFRIEFQ